MVQLIAWDCFPTQFNDKVKSEVNRVAAWLHDEYASGNITSEYDLQDYVMRELEKIDLSAMPAPRLGRALLLMAFYGLLNQPNTISFDDIENARWLLESDVYGYPSRAPNPDKFKNHPKTWFRK